MESQVQAAITIQAQWRRFVARKEYRKRHDAALTIQEYTSRFLARKQAAKDEEQQQRSARFKVVMARHQERIQALEHEKRLIRGLPMEQLDELEAKRHAAAATIQAHWRGAQQRQQLRQDFPALAGLRPITCCSPTLPDDPSSLSAVNSSVYRTPHAAQQQPHHAPGPNLIRTMRQQQLMQERSTASGLAGEASRGGLAGEASGPVLAYTTGQGLAASTSHWTLMPCAEESSWLSAECSKLSAAAGTGTEDSSSRGQRRAALPAANRAMLERQMKTRVDAVSAHPSTLRAVREKQQQTDQRLQQLLQEHNSTEGRRLQAVRRRQRLLQKADMLHGHLKQLPALEALSDSCWPAQYSLPRPGSKRSERAQQAHALSLGQAQTQSKWWTPLKQLSHMYSLWASHAVVDSKGVGTADGVGFLRLQHDWQQDDVAWRSSWAHIQEQEQQRT